MKIHPRNITEFEDLNRVLSKVKSHINTQYNMAFIHSEGKWLVTYDVFFSSYNPTVEVMREDVLGVAYVTKKYHLKEFRKLTHLQIFEEFFPNPDENTPK